MDALEKEGLSGNGLICINTPELVKRYNDCLVDAGIEPTHLTEFCIDCAGWSPEIAQEKDDRYYLFLGEANPVAVIVTPQQRYSPIYVPFHTFDWELMKQWFDTHKSQIAELTKSTGIWLNLDQGIDEYYSVEDLLLVDNIRVVATTPQRLMVAAQQQKDLVRQFLSESKSVQAQIDALYTLPDQLLASVQAIGDVRHKPMVIDDMSFSVPRSFYTQAFGGMFVLRSPDEKKESLFSREQATQDAGVTGKMDQSILQKLKCMGLIGYDVERWLNELFRLEIIRDSFLMDVASDIDPDLDYAVFMNKKNGKAQRKAFLTRKEVRDKLPEEYKLLDRLITRLRHNDVPRKISAKIKPYLAHPLPHIDASIAEVVWYLLALVCDGRSIVRLYRYDKEAFMAQYATWAKPRQTWAIAQVKKHYQHRMLRKEQQWR